ncbi:hypothetical protein HELRODRAFT_164780 [Helobdella robusta]|uniref:Tetrapyrrole biosynthesis uroporphyrinogen III synthase domain-containing protein n=1 Tax=Helobdella robusta TaxID=6412 RepID=T1EVT1_HELRO|nr:hypothetical protein HELRODRAFT_164780 [Helobdella robusta]ESN92691.1 hypothetical protein HELRODRAFT_164780 [Helobdella robusta]
MNTSDCQSVRILLLKSFNSDVGPMDDRYVKELRSSNFIVDCIPALEFEFMNDDKLIKVLRCPDMYADLIVTSPRSCEAISNLIAQNNLSLETAQSLGLSVVGEQAGSADALSDIIINDYLENINSKPLLFLGAEEKLDILPNKLNSKAVHFIELAVYRSRKHSMLDVNLCNYLAKPLLPDYVVFFSPSIVRYSADVLKGSRLVEHSRIIAIGASTHKEMTSSSMFSDVSFNNVALLKKPDVNTLIQTLKSFSYNNNNNIENNNIKNVNNETNSNNNNHCS